MQLDFLKDNFGFLKPDEFNVGIKVNSEIGKIYSLCYYSSIRQLLGETCIDIDIDLSIFNSLDDYHKYHLISLIISSGNKEKVKKFSIDSIKDGIKYLIEYDNSNMWYVSNIHMGILNIIDTYNIKTYTKIVNDFFDKLIKSKFSSTNFKYKGSINRIAAFYHYLPYIHKNNIYINEELSNLLIGDIKKNQNELGSFCFPNGFSCIELDFTQSLVYFFKKTNDSKLKLMLENKFFNSQFTFNKSWDLYPLGNTTTESFFHLTKIALLKKMDFMSYLWNIKRILTMNGYQIDNSITELKTKKIQANLMSNFFGLIIYLQLQKTLNIDNYRDGKLEGIGLGYII